MSSHEISSDGQSSDRPSHALSRLYLILCVLYMGCLIWHLIPDQQRTEFRMSLARLCARGTSVLALRTGAASLAHEAATGRQHYAVPYRLSLLRIAFERAYERARKI